MSSASDHPGTLVTAMNLAVAVRLSTDVWERLREAFSDDNPRTLAAVVDLASYLIASGDTERARAVMASSVGADR